MSTLVFTAVETFLWRKGDPFNFISPAPPPCSRRPKRRDAAKKELVDVLRAYPAFLCLPLDVDSCCRRCSCLVSLKSYSCNPFFFFSFHVRRTNRRTIRPKIIKLDQVKHSLVRTSIHAIVHIRGIVELCPNTRIAFV